MTAPPTDRARPAAPTTGSFGTSAGPRPGSGTGRGGGTHVRSGPRPPAVRRALRLGAVLGVLVIAYAVITAVVSRPAGHGYLDITSADGYGSRAVAEILRARGVTVTAGEQLPASATAPGAAGTPTGRTVVVTNPDLLSQADLDTLVTSTRTGSDVVLVAPDSSVVAALGLPVTAGQRDGGDYGDESPPGCALPEATTAGSTTVGDSVTFAHSNGQGGQGGRSGGTRVELCYGDPGAARLAVLTPTRSDVGGGPTGRLVLLGGGGFLTNERLGETGNAALALGLLARAPRLDWVTPVVAAGDAVGTKSLAELLPDGFWLGALQLLVVLMFLALWQGRRLGPPIEEPLPVVVRSTETVEGRGRLYAAAHARERAAAALRAGLRARLADRLGVQTAPAGSPWHGRGPDPTVLVASVAEQTGRSPMEIGPLLYGSDMAPTGYSPPPWPAYQGPPVSWAAPVPSGPVDVQAGGARRDTEGDVALVRLARALHELDRQVGRR
ncbi:DUF4350 domain-containing protein [Parafrankia discariae]|uniref:DUF4350 domain-containing protein n=1 Tax=Parafrankia discariae TaxID=365528 RepID=UPI000381B1DB|nr:DUF4350 domain-containing protein [Parafrankia discariae]